MYAKQEKESELHFNRIIITHKALCRVHTSAYVPIRIHSFLYVNARKIKIKQKH